MYKNVNEYMQGIYIFANVKNQYIVVNYTYMWHSVI